MNLNSFTRINNTDALSLLFHGYDDAIPRDGESLRRLQLYAKLQLSMLLHRLHVDQSVDSEETVPPVTDIDRRYLS